MVSDAQKRAKAKYEATHRKENNYRIKRSSARGFIRNFATLEDLEDLQEMIRDKIQEKKAK